MKRFPLCYSILICGLILLSCESKPAGQTESTPTEKTIANNVQDDKQSPIKTRFEAEIQAFEKGDAIKFYKSNGILYTGSSSIRMWKGLAKDMDDLRGPNRGFGGATIPEVIQYMDRYLFIHQPQIIVFYCGENDIAEGASPETVLASFQEFVTKVETKLPDVKFVFISMKPSLARWNLWDKYQAGNQLIANYITTKSNMEYMDCALSMLEENGQVKDDIFIADGLHMNEKGYALWTQQLTPILEKIYEK